MPKDAFSNLHTFKICKENNCVPGTTIATFGRLGPTDQQQISTKPVSKETHSILYSHVTDIMNSQNWGPENLRAEMTSTLVKGIPQPLIIIRNIKNGAEEVTLGPEQRREDYGDLLERFTVL